MHAIVLDETLDITERARRVLPPLGVRVSFAGSLGELAVLLGFGRPHELLIVNLTGALSAWQLAQQIRQTGFDGRLVVLMPRHAQSSANPLAGLPRTECIIRPLSVDDTDALLTRAAAGPAAPPPPAASPPAAPVPQGLVGRSPAMLEIFSRIQKVASADVNVCIYGESGTGKELIARAIHGASGRRDRPFVPLDCAAIPEGLMESQLFGHVRGAFTGAVDRREGVFTLANTGTLFLDELCELSVPLQAKLLRVVQTREFVPVGGSRTARANVRLVTATNKDPRGQVERGEFREDLYYRVAVVMIKVPPLRDRHEDIPVLAEHFVQTFAQRHRKPLRRIEPDALARLMAEPWPGNVRQLENFIEQAVVFAEGDTLRENDLFGNDTRRPGQHVPSASDLAPGLPLREVERRYILRTLHATRGNRTEAARQLGISIRSLQYKLKEYRDQSPI